MIYENSLIESLVKNHIDKATIKIILSDLILKTKLNGIVI